MKPRHCFLMILTAVMLYMMVFPLLNEVGVPPGRYVSIFLGVFLQAAPFLAIGVLLSSLIQVYLRTDWIQRKFPGKILAGQLFAAEYRQRRVKRVQTGTYLHFLCFFHSFPVCE